MGISMIDDQPKELLYATLTDFKVDFSVTTMVGSVSERNKDQLNQTRMELKLSIGNLQVDNMLQGQENDSMAVMFCPT